MASLITKTGPRPVLMRRVIGRKFFIVFLDPSPSRQARRCALPFSTTVNRFGLIRSNKDAYPAREMRNVVGECPTQKTLVTLTQPDTESTQLGTAVGGSVFS